MTAPFQARFLAVDDTPLASRFVIHHPARPGPPRALVVYVHPFAEEMNKSRRMAAMQARALAEANVAVLQVDLLGCGDSAGDFGDATWSRWVTDVVAAVRWLVQQHPLAEGGTAPPLWLWGLRAGALLAVEAGAQLASEGTPFHLLFWQPTTSGKVLLQQFLRLKAAGELMAGQAKAAMDRLRAELAAGRTVEVAGYALAPALCQGLEQATLRPPAAAAPGRLVWLEVTPVERPELAPAGTHTLNVWREAGWDVQPLTLRGPAFWQTTEIEDAPALVDATLHALASGASLQAPAAEAAAP